MKDQVSRRQILKGVAAAGVLGGLSVPSAAFANGDDARSGLAVLRIAYSDGLDGVLVVSCMLPVGSPHSMDEGFNATRHFVNFFHPDPPTAGNHSNRTAFHVLRHGEDD